MEKHCSTISTSATQLCPVSSTSILSLIIPVQPLHRQNCPSINICTDYFKGLPLRLQTAEYSRTHWDTTTSQMFIHSETLYLSRRNVYLATVSVGMKWILWFYLVAFLWANQRENKALTYFFYGQTLYSSTQLYQIFIIYSPQPHCNIHNPTMPCVMMSYSFTHIHINPTYFPHILRSVIS